MTAMAQALHVARKDLRESRWPLIVYAAFVVFAAVRAIWLWSPSGPVEMAMFLVVIAGLVLVGVVVQSDSPTQTEMFWATRPFSPVAVLLSKILIITLIVAGLPVVGQALALSSFDIHGPALTHRLATAAWAYARWLIVALALAALTKDIKTFVVAIVSLSIATAVGTDLWESVVLHGIPIDAQPNSMEMSSWRVIAWLGIAGCAALPFWLYAKRDRGWRSLVVGALIIACGFGDVLIGALGSDASPPSGAPRGETPRNAIQIAFPPGVSLNPNEIRLEVRVASAQPGQRLTLSGPQAELLLADGSKLRIPTNPPILELGLTRPASLDNSTWLVPNRDSAIVRTLIVRPELVQQRLLAKSIKSITISGRLVASTPRVIGNLDLSAGSRLAAPGRRVSVAGGSEANGAAELNLNAIELPTVGAQRWSQVFTGSGVVSFALVNAARHEALPMTVRGTGGGASWLVLPGDQVVTTSLYLDTRDAFAGQPSTIDFPWFAGARLWLIDWLPVESYPVRAELAVP